MKKNDTKFTKAALVGAAHEFGVSPEMMAGALYDVDEATRAEVERRIKIFQQKEVER